MKIHSILLLAILAIFINNNIEAAVANIITDSEKAGIEAGKAAIIQGIEMAVKSVEKIIDKKGESLKNIKTARDLLHELHAEIKELKPNATEAYKQIEKTIKETKNITRKLGSTESSLLETIVQKLEDSAKRIKTQILK